MYSSSCNLRATERHLPYIHLYSSNDSNQRMLTNAITQCYLPPDTGERAPP